MNEQSLTLVPTDWLNRMEQRIKELGDRLDGATVVPAPEWLKISDAARKLGVDRSTIHRRIANGTIVAKGDGKLRRVKVD